jgi:hypothetical protein
LRPHYRTSTPSTKSWITPAANPGLPAPEKADLPIIDEDLVATEAVTPPGGSTTNDDEGHV